MVSLKSQRPISNDRLEYVGKFGDRRDCPDFCSISELYRFLLYKPDP